MTMTLSRRSEKFEYYCPLCTKILQSTTKLCPECDNPPPIHGWPKLANCSFPLLGTRVEGRFVFDRFLGSGASGDVYRVYSETFPRKFAVKIFDSRRYVKKELNDELMERFNREIKVLSQLDNPHIVSIFDALRLSESSYAYFMDFIPGTTLQQLLDRIERLKLLDSLRIVRQVASALADLHSLKLIHCDIKPDNIIIQRFIPQDFFARLVDFGLVRSIGIDKSRYEGFRGSPLYASPEQCVVSKNLDQRSDIYALGCVLFHCITGKPPYTGSSDFAVIQAQVNAPIPSLRESAPHLRISQRLENLIESMLCKNRKGRPGSMGEVIQIIDRIIVYDVHTAEARTIADSIEISGVGFYSASPSEGAYEYVSAGTANRLIQPLAEFPIPSAIDKDARRFSTISFYARTRVILADYHNVIHDLSLYQGAPVHSCKCGDSTITAVAFINEEQAIVAVDLMQDIWFLSPTGEHCAKKIARLSERAYAMTGGRNHNEILIGKESGELVMLDIGTKKTTSIYQGGAMVASLALTVAIETMIVIGCWDCTVQVLFQESMELVPLKPTSSVPISLAISNDGTVAAALTHGKKVRIYDLADPNVYFDIMADETNISKIVFGPNSELLGISVNHSVIQLWDINIDAIRRQFLNDKDKQDIIL